MLSNEYIFHLKNFLIINEEGVSMSNFCGGESHEIYLIGKLDEQKHKMYFGNLIA